MAMDKTYTPHNIERKWQQQWEQENAFEPSGQGDPYCIMIPPPNITGTLHMGHGFQLTLMDTIIRYQRMQGKNTLWQMGTDHAGIATQMVVERQLKKQGTSRKTIGRDAFVNEVWKWKEQSGNTITEQIRRIGASVSWKSEAFTLDEPRSHAVKQAFIKLHQQGLIYRGKKLVNWDPTLQTAVSDLEVIHKEIQGSMWTIRYPLASGEGYLEIATTRPETLFGDQAVAVHPKDARYKKFIGKTVKLPLTDREIPILADDYVDPKFGTGCVKITPAHDFNDDAMGKRHNLAYFNILRADGTLNEHTPKAYQGLTCTEARKQILADLQQAQLLIKTEPHMLNVPYGDRSGAVIEPWLTDQWFVKMEPLAKPALDEVAKGNLKFKPENWVNTYNQWLNNIEDWCISRQLWWGHRIPAWYDDQGNSYVGDDEASVRKAHNLDANTPLKQDEDVLDTWFSSALWPFSALGWPEKTVNLETFFPTQLLVTGFDIIFFWVARMVMMSLHFTGKLPFAEVYITGLIRDHDGHKMSKSKGNTLNPIHLIDGITLEGLLENRIHGLMQPDMEQKIIAATKKHFPEGISAHGTDALRFTFCALASTGRDIRFDLQRLTGYRNFCNKLWNAARFILMQLPQQPIEPLQPNQAKDLINRWLMHELDLFVADCHRHLQTYRFDLLAKRAYEFIWNQFCDWYLECAKNHLKETQTPVYLETTRTLYTAFTTILHCVHPIIPFITEELNAQLSAHLGTQLESLITATYPQSNPAWQQPKVSVQMNWLQEVIVAIRTLRAEMNISPATAIPLLAQHGNSEDQTNLKDCSSLLSLLAKTNSIQWLDEQATVPPSATCLVGQLQLHVPLKGLIDKAKELQRLQKLLQTSEQQITSMQSRLANPNFSKQAPKQVVAQTEEQLKKQQHMLEALQQQHRKIAAIE
jgi:valyl-tRNA synthetase